MKIYLVALITFLLQATNSYAVQVAFFTDNLNPHLPLEENFFHIAISYKGQWLHSAPGEVRGRLAAFPGVHLSSTLLQIGPDFVVYENPYIEEPSEEFYNQFKTRRFNVLASWDSKTETNCSILVGKYLGVTPSRMWFKSRAWKNVKVGSARGRLGLSPDDIYKHIAKDPQFYVYFKSPFAKLRSVSSAPRCQNLFSR